MRRIWSLAAIPASLLLAETAFAHPGHGTGFVAGLVHPFTGVDHLAAMTMVGLWSGLAFPHSRLRLPAIMLATMLAGFCYGERGGAMGGSELLIQGTLVVLALTLVLKLKLRSHAAALLVGVTGLAHGFAHGIEVPAGSDPRSFLAGFILSSMVLLMAGLGLARLAKRAGFRAAVVPSTRAGAD
jgi:urease accessory protein